MAKKWKTALRITVLVLVSLILGVNLYLWNAQSLTGNALPMPFGYGAALVLTGSMEPTIMADDLIFVKEADTFAPGDIVVFQSGSVLVVHRVLEVTEDSLITQGDANNVTDDPVALKDVKGIVLGWLPNAGTLVRLLKSPWATVILIAGAILMVEGSFRAQKKKDQDELDKIKEEIRRLKDSTLTDGETEETT